MKKVILFVVTTLLITTVSFAQDSLRPLVPVQPPVRKKEPIDLSTRANDHFLIQVGYTNWAGKPDSITTRGFSKSINVYFMFDFPFKSNPKLSMAFGPGIASDNIQFSKTYVGIKENATTIQFTDQSDTNHFKRSKLVTTYLEAPVEFRFTADPVNSGKSFKFAIGAKVGTMINAHTRNKSLETASGQTINDYSMKESSKKFFNTTRLVGTARVGMGHFSLYGSYQITTLFKEGFAADIRPYSIGLTLSGL
ncbi:MAG TPA: outer membrane beta-barrel protein [Chitinophagaceae bacterium]|nr:outer membrane beta-barrel protein [Chitinophagaceae bacterium]